MAIFGNMQITNAGQALYVKAQAGKPIIFTKLSIGSGQIGTQNPVTLTNLVLPEFDVAISSISPNTIAKSAAISGMINNDNMLVAMYICEIGLWATDPDTGLILYGYASAGTQGDYMAPATQGAYSWMYQVNATIGNAANVTANISNLEYDYSVLSTDTTFNVIAGGNQKAINKSIDNELNALHYLTYKSIAGTISSTFSIADDQIQACVRMGLDICVCPMVSILNATDPILVKLDDSLITECLNRIKLTTVKPIMIKPHIGIGGGDNFNRKNYIPSDINLFFSNWTNLLLDYASICNTYDIPILCVSVEMVALTINDYANNWETLYNTLKSAFPKLSIIHAPKIWEFTDDNHELSLQWADILGCTLYMNYSYNSFVGDTVNTYEDIGKSIYSDTSNFVDKINQRCNKYNKKFYIAEIGCMHVEDGLIDVVPRSYSLGNSVTNYYVQSSLIEGFFKYLCNNLNIVGFSWWHLRTPFEIWSATSTLPGEAMMTKYVKGGLI